MGIDEFLERHSGSWARLDELTRRGARSPRRLESAEIVELVTLYQRTVANLSYATTHFSEPAITLHLSQLVARAGAVVYGTRPRTFRALKTFVTRTIPGAVWHVRRFVLVSALLTFIPALAIGFWLSNSPRAVDLTVPSYERQALVQHEFSNYYRSAPSAQFASSVYTNNVEVAFYAFAGGVIFCIPTAVVLVENGMNLGVDSGLMISAGKSSEFWVLVIPHGLVELTSVVIAGAAGLRLGWALVDPGDRRRLSALAEEGRRCVVLIIAVVVSLAVAGSIEGFVTGSSLPAALRVGIGVTMETLFLAYLFIYGRRAAAEGFTGLIGEHEGSWVSRLTAPQSAR